MDLIVEELPGGITRAALVGRMDIEGAQQVDMPFNALAGFKRVMVVDLAEVSFMASMGLRTLMVCARAIAAKGGKMVLARPQPGVASVLETSGIGDLIGVYPSLDAAVAAVTA